MARRSDFRECEGEGDDDGVKQERAVTDEDDNEIGNDFGAVAPTAWRPREPGTQPDDAGKLVTRDICDGAEPCLFSKPDFVEEKS